MLGTSVKQQVLGGVRRLQPARFTIIKVPSHCAVPAHDLVDAQAALAVALIGPVPFLSTPWAHARRELIASGYADWMRAVPEKSTFSTLIRMIPHKQQQRPWTLNLPSGLSMLDMALLHGLRLHRHKKFAEVHELAGREPPLCQCGSPLCWSHLCECPPLAELRGPLSQIKVDHPYDLLYVKPRLVLNFLAGLGISNYKQETNNICMVHHAGSRPRPTGRS